jgi:hypothetical protein
VVTFSAASCAYSCTSLRLASMAFIFGSPMSSVHTCALSLQSFVHSSYIFLILTTFVISILTLPSCTSSGVLRMLLGCKSWIFSLKPFMNSLIFDNCSSIVASITEGTSGTYLYNFWTIGCVFYTMVSTSSFSCSSFVALSLAPYLLFKTSSIRPSISFFC